MGQTSQRLYAPTPPSQSDAMNGRVDYLGVVVAYDLPPAFPDEPGRGVHLFKWTADPLAHDDAFQSELRKIAGDELEGVHMAGGAQGRYICEFYCTYAEARDMVLKAAERAWRRGAECEKSCEAAGRETCPGVMRKRAIMKRRAERLAS